MSEDLVKEEVKESLKKVVGKLAVVRVRGSVKVRKDIEDTMQMLGLYRKNYCVIVGTNQLGMIKKVKDYVTYGEIDPDAEKLLIEKKGEKRKDQEGKEIMKKFFRLITSPSIRWIEA